MSRTHWTFVGALVLSVAILYGAGRLMWRGLLWAAKDELHRAAARGDLAMVKSLVNSGVNVDTRDDGRWTPLESAAYNGRYEVAKFLVSKGADVNRSDEDGCTPLDKAAESEEQNPNMVKLLIAHSAKVNVKDGLGNTPLHIAMYRGNVKVVAALLAAGADINAEDSGGWPPIHWASNQPVRELLLAHGARIDTIYLAAELGMVRRVEEMLRRNPKALNSVSEDGKSALHYAVARNQVSMIGALLRRGADVNATDLVGLTPLHEAISPEAARALVARGASLNARSKEGLTPLHAAVQEGRASVVNYLISCGADVNEKDNSRKTPLHYAVESNGGNTVRALLAAGADVNAKGAHSRTPLHYAILEYKTPVVGILVSAKGVNVSAVDDSGSTPLDYAVDRNDQRMTRILKEHGAVRGLMGNSPYVHDPRGE